MHTGYIITPTQTTSYSQPKCFCIIYYQHDKKCCYCYIATFKNVGKSHLVLCFARNFFVRECDSRITIVLFIPLLYVCAKIFKNPPSRFLRSTDCFIQPSPPPHAFSEDKQPGDNFKGICKVTDRH